MKDILISVKKRMTNYTVSYKEKGDMKPAI